MTADEVRAAVREYTARGWVCHPLSKPDEKGDNRGKRPLLKNWQNLTKTPPDINKYIEDGCNIGLVCGRVSGVTVLDLDHQLFVPDIMGDFDLDMLKSRRIEGRGHMYFTYNESLPSQKHHDLGIEILNDGSNAVLPPLYTPFRKYLPMELS